MPRRFPLPWTVEEQETWLAVRDRDGLMNANGFDAPPQFIEIILKG